MTKTVILAVTDDHRPIGFFKGFTGPKRFESSEWTYLVTDAYDFESKDQARRQVKEFHQKTAAEYYVAEVTFCERK